MTDSEKLLEGARAATEVNKLLSERHARIRDILFAVDATLIAIGSDYRQLDPSANPYEESYVKSRAMDILNTVGALMKEIDKLIICATDRRSARYWVKISGNENIEHDYDYDERNDDHDEFTE